VKITLADYLRATDDKKFEYLLDDLKSTSKANLQAGAGRFEALLEPFNMGGAVNDRVRALLHELFHVRNLIVHKGGRADTRFIAACPSFSLSTGQRVTLTAWHARRYIFAVQWYLFEISVMGEMSLPADERIHRHADKAELEQVVDAQHSITSILEDIEKYDQSDWVRRNI
jgi:hypothetical protein